MRNETHFSLASLNERIAELLEDLNDRVMRRYGERARGRGFGERLLLDAVRLVVDVADHIWCVGLIVDAKDERVLTFYEQYDFVVVQAEGWPRRMFMPIGTAGAALEEQGTE